MTSKKDLLAWLPRERPVLPPWYDGQVVYAVRAVEQGIANEGQQKLFWRYVMYVTGASDEFNDLSFRPGGLEGDRDTVFAEGKRFVGLMIRKLLRSELTPHDEKDGPASVRERLAERRKKPVKGNDDGNNG